MGWYTLDKRIVEVYSNGIWIQTEFEDLRQGDRFRLFESDGERVVDDKGRNEWIASSNAFMKLGDWVINVY